MGVPLLYLPHNLVCQILMVIRDESEIKENRGTQHELLQLIDNMKSLDFFCYTSLQCAQYFDVII